MRGGEADAFETAHDLDHAEGHGADLVGDGGDGECALAEDLARVGNDVKLGDVDRHGRGLRSVGKIG